MRREGDRLIVVARGDWTLAHATALDAELDRLEVPAGTRTAEVDLGAVTTLDTAGAWLVQRTCNALITAGLSVSLRNISPSAEALLATVNRTTAEPAPAVGASPGKAVEILAQIGRGTFALGRGTGRLLSFFGLILFRVAGAVIRPRSVRLTSLVYHMEQTGLNALPIIGLLSFLIGVVLAYQGAEQLRQFGAELFVVNLLGISILRELGVLITAIIVAGRSGSAFTAQIGTMRVNQEVDAMQTIGLDPISILVLPRVLALCVTLPVLAFFADMVGLLGGAVMSYFTLDISFGQFLQQLRSAVAIKHFWAGIVKAPVFAFTIAMVGCYQGLRVSGSAESVGRLTTQAVVESIFLVIVLDAMFSILFATLGV